MPPLTGIASYMSEFETAPAPARKVEKTPKQIHAERASAKLQKNKDTLKEKVSQWD